MACIFCEIVAGSQPANFVHRDELVSAVWDVQPKAPTHILVIPNQHVETLDDLDDPELAGRLLLVCRQVAAQQGVAGGYRVVTNVGRSGGQHVWHLHFHVLAGRPLGWPPG